MVMEDGGVANFKLGSLFMHPFPTCCTRITNVLNKAVILSNVFIQHEGLTCYWKIRGNE